MDRMSEAKTTSKLGCWKHRHINPSVSWEPHFALKSQLRRKVSLAVIFITLKFLNWEGIWQKSREGAWQQSTLVISNFRWRWVRIVKNSKWGPFIPPGAQRKSWVGMTNVSNRSHIIWGHSLPVSKGKNGLGWVKGTSYDRKRNR
jgi:hypothetical protein